jgi:hypothetical protein
VFIQKAAAEVQSLGKFNDPNGLYARLPFELQLN